MKKKLALLLALMMAVVLLFAACEGDKPTEEHVHDYGTLIAEVPATCTTAGTKAHYHCSGCNKDFDSEKNEITDLAIPTVAHTEVVDAAVAATCTTDGKTEGKHCSVCGTVTVAQTTIPATGHTESGEWIVDKAAACEEAGSRHKVCSVCGETAVTETIPATGHTEGEWITDAEATCTEAGSKHQVCSVCDKTIATEVIPASHTFGEWVEGTAATCDDDGTKGYFYCSVCEKYFDESGEEITDFVIPATGHTPALVEEIAPTCGDSGVKAHYHCEACGKDFDEAGNELTAEDLAIPATGHTWTELYVPKVNAASCAEPGMKAHYYCPDCGKYFDAKKKTEVTEESLLLFADHTFGGLIAEVPATCEHNGNVAYYHCSVCEKYFDENKNEISDPIIPTSGHTYQQVGELTKKGTSYVIPCHCPICGKDIDAEYKLTANFRRFLYDGDVCTGISPADESTLEAHYYCAEFDKYLNLNLEEITAADLKPSTAIGISNDADTAAFAKMVTDGNAFAGESFVLLADVNLNTLIGYTGSGSNRKPFSGNFDGLGHTVTITQSVANPDGDGGLFSFIRIPENSSVTIQNVHVKGTISLNNNATGMGYVGGLISTVDASKSGNGGTINISNVWNTVRINGGNSNAWNSIGGMIGFIRHEDGLKPITVNIDSCVWDGVINCGPALYHGGGFIGYTGNNRPGRTLTINITNSLASGTFMLNIDGWNQQFGTLISYAKGNNSEEATAKVTINISNVISTAKATFSKNTGSGSTIGLIEEISGTTVLNLTDVYYVAFERKGMEGEFPVVAAGDVTTSTNVAEKTLAELQELTAADFEGAADQWVFVEGAIPYPSKYVSTYGHPSLVEIRTVEEFLAFRDDVNNGADYSGRTVKLTADIDLEGIEWVSIGVPGNTKSANCKSFCGTFDGQGHTIANMTTDLAPKTGYVDMQGALFGSLGNGAVVKNFTLTGSIKVANYSTSGESDYFASVANAVKGTVLIQNVKSTVNITTSNNKNPDSGSWAKGVGYVGGLVGFIYHDTAADLTIDGCEYAGTINCANNTKGTAGIMSFTGNNANDSTKVVTITDTVFSGSITLNDNSGAYAFEATGGIFGNFKSGTLNISNTHSEGKIFFNRTKAWPTENISAGQIVGIVSGDATCSIDETVTYKPAYLYTEVEEGTPVPKSKFILGEIGKQGENYAVDTAAVVIEAAAE